MNAKKAKKHRKEYQQLAMILLHEKKNIKYRKPYRVNLLNKCKKLNSINEFFKLCRDLGLNEQEIAKKYFRTA